MTFLVKNRLTALGRSDVFEETAEYEGAPTEEYVKGHQQGLNDAATAVLTRRRGYPAMVEVLGVEEVQENDINAPDFVM